MSDEPQVMPKIPSLNKPASVVISAAGKQLQFSVSNGPLIQLSVAVMPTYVLQLVLSDQSRPKLQGCRGTGNTGNLPPVDGNFDVLKVQGVPVLC